MPQGKILIVDDDVRVLSALQIFLQSKFEEVEVSGIPSQIPSLLSKKKYDVTLLDMNFSAGINNGNEGLYWLQEIKKIAPDMEVVMFTAYGDVNLAVKALKNGASDFVLKPWENEKLLATLKSAIKLSRSVKEIQQLKSRETSLRQELKQDLKFIPGNSSAMQKVMNLVAKVADTDANVLITGENGTGKELIAREIHQQSGRSDELFVTVDTGAISAHLLESELFGHKKGAFTDAREERAGKFKLADKGTLFLDEIGNMPLSMQAKLLVVLQSRKIVAVGSDKEFPVNIRLISATNSDIGLRVNDQKFREDLLYRLNTIHIEVPPLRERDEDIETLACHFIRKFGKKYKKHSLGLSTQAVSKLTKYHWPGNVRELEHTMEKAVILCEGKSLKSEDFIFKPLSNRRIKLPETIEEMEKVMIETSLDKTNGNLSLSADQLGITRQTLYNKLKKYGL